MQITIKYFGLLAEITKCDSEQIDFKRGQIKNLIELLFNKYPQLKTKDFQVALNHQIVSITEEITTSEIALLPPFSGG